MSSHHRHFTWTFAVQNPKDPREARYNAEDTAELNSGATLAIVDKQPSSTIIDNLRDWEKDAVYEIARPHRSRRGFSLTDLKFSSPEKHIVGKPSTEEQLALINHGKLIGSLEGGKIVKIHQAEDSTGAIPVMDCEVPGEMFYYIPAQIEGLAMSHGAFETKPSFVVMKDGEMPSYVFWKRKAEFPPSYSESDLIEQHRAIRSGAPTPEVRPAPVAGPASETRPAPLAVNMNKAAEAEEKQAQPMWEIFDPRLEEDPLEFLEYYNVCLNGRKGIRNKLMLREADIDRVNYISPCLAHNHKEIDEESGAVTIEDEETAMDVDPVPTVPSPKPAGVSTPKTTSPAASKPWVQPGPIPDDDPSWLRLLARQDRERQIRGARIRPKPVFTSEFCNAPGTTTDPKKAVLRRELYDKYYHRAVTANREIESRSKCCLACGLQWTQCLTTRQAHYKQHRDELKLYRRHCQNQNILLEDPLRVESLDPAKAPMIKSVPALNWFRDLEQIILNMENELLEREQTCRICDAHVDFADESMADHYEKHAVERKQLRTIGAIANSVPTTPTVIVTPDGASVINSTAQSSPAAAYTRPSTTPEYLRRIYEKLDEERVKKALEESAKMADIMVNVAEQIRETGTLSSPISLSSGSKSSEPVITASDDVMDTTEDGPVHSDVIGNTTAQRVFPPFMTPVSQSPTDAENVRPRHAQSQEDDLDFLYKYDAHTVTSQAPTPGLDYYLDQLWTFCQATDIPRNAAKDAYGMVKLCFESNKFTDMNADLLFVACGWIACRNNETPRTLQEFSELCGYSIGEIKSAIEKMPTCFDAVGSSVRSSSTQNRNAQSEVIVIQDDDSDLYASPAPGPADSIEEHQADNDQAEIVQAIRSNSGELLALDDATINDSEDAEEVLDAGVIQSEDEEEQMEVPEESEVDVEDNAEEVPKEFGRIKVDDAENSDGSARSETWYPPDDGLFDNLEPSSELSKASDSLKTELELDAAKLLAHAMGQKVLRRMKKKLDLEKAFLALESTEALIFTVENEHRDGLVTQEQEIYGRLIDRLFTLDKKIERNRPVNSDQFNFRDVYLTSEDLLNGVHLKWYDIWRVVNKAKEAFLEWVAQNSKDSLSTIREQIVELLRCVLKDTSLYGYSDEPFPIEDKVPVRHDRLDLRYGDLRIDRLLTNAHRWGCGFNNMMALSDEAWKMATDMVKAERASPSAQGPEVARLSIVNQVQKHVRSEIRKEKRWRLAQGQRLGQQGLQGQQWTSQVTPEVSSAKWSTEAVASTTPHTPLNSPWTPGVPSSPRKPNSSGSSKESSKRNRPAPLPTPVSNRKRKASDDLFQPGPPTPFNPDEVSPRLPKKPRKSSDSLYRPGSALLDPTTPPATPRAPKRTPNREANGRFAKKAEKKQDKKGEQKKKGKKVTFDAALSSKSSASAPLSSLQVVITKKVSGRKPSSAVTTKKTTKPVAPKSTNSGVKKTAVRNEKTEPVAAASRPKRQAAIEAEKSFGKTKIVG